MHIKSPRRPPGLRIHILLIHTYYQSTQTNDQVYFLLFKCHLPIVSMELYNVTSSALRIMWASMEQDREVDLLILTSISTSVFIDKLSAIFEVEWVDDPESIYEQWVDHRPLKPKNSNLRVSSLLMQFSIQSSKVIGRLLISGSRLRELQDDLELNARGQKNSSQMLSISFRMQQRGSGGLSFVSFENRNAKLGGGDVLRNNGDA